MYKCRDCESIFEELKRHSYIDYDTCYNGIKYVCPFCYSDDICDMVKCVSCGKEVPKDEMNGEICDVCIRKLQKDAINFIDNYSVAEQEIIIDFLNEK